MITENNRSKNKNIWHKFYSDRSQALKHPDENLIRLFSSAEPKIKKPPATLLDHGFGSGNNSLYFAQQGYQVCGVEICDSAIRLVQDTFKSHVLTGDFRLIQDTNIPYPDRTFDIVVSWNCIHYNGSEEKVSQVRSELYRLLKPGGVIILSTITTDHTLCKGAEHLGEGLYRVSRKHRFDERGGLRLYVPQSKEHFLKIYSHRYKNIQYGWIDVNLFVPDKTLSCHLMYGEK